MSDHQGDSSNNRQDDNNAYYYNYYLAQAHANPELHGIAGAANYEHQRGIRQLNHYFDVNQMPTAIPQQQVAPSAPPKPTVAQIKYYKEQQEKRKRMKNKWLYE